MHPVFTAVWNIADADARTTKLVNRTSNSLEQYNRHFNGILPTDHPNLVVFVAGLQKDVKRVVQRIKDVRVGRERPPKYDEDVIPEVPADFITYCRDWKKREKAKAEAEKKKADAAR